MAGVFTNAEDGFDAKQHTIKLKIAPGTALREGATKAKAKKATGVSSTDLYIVSVANSVNGTVDTVTAGSTMWLVGGKLKFNKTDEEQSVFVMQDGATMRCAQVIENKPLCVVVLLPTSMRRGSLR